MPKHAKISVDEFLSARSHGVGDSDTYFRAIGLPKSMDEETRSLRLVMTDETVDSYGDIVRAKGADLERFEKNPIALLNHRYDNVIGNWSDVTKKSKSVEGTMTFANAGTSPLVDSTFNLVSQGMLRAASIGFRIKAVKKILDDEGEWTYGYDITEWVMYECSVVSVPANPNALAKSMKDGESLPREILEHVLDTYAKTGSGLIVPRSELEAAHKEGSGNKSSMVVEINAEALNKSIDKLSALVEKHPDLQETDDEPQVDPIVAEMTSGAEELIKSAEEQAAELSEEDDADRVGVVRATIERAKSAIAGIFGANEPEPADPEQLKVALAKAKALKEELAVKQAA
ncbi:MAG: HK97 family phage prohead protease [Pseudomonadota bacterium]